MMKMSEDLKKDVEEVWEDDKKMISFEASLANKIFKLEASERV